MRTCFNRVETIDPERQIVTTSDGNEVGYWRIAVCTGAVPSVPPMPGLAEHAMTMWSVADAQELQRRVNAQLKLAARMPDSLQRQDALSVTVCGGGATGLEIIGTIGQLLPKRAAEIGLDPEDLRMSLVEGRPQILYDLPEAQRLRAASRLEAGRAGVRRLDGRARDRRGGSPRRRHERSLDRAGVGRRSQGRPPRRPVGVRALGIAQDLVTPDLKARASTARTR